MSAAAPEGALDDGPDMTKRQAAQAKQVAAAAAKGYARARSRGRQVEGRAGAEEAPPSAGKDAGSSQPVVRGGEGETRKKGKTSKEKRKEAALAKQATVAAAKVAAEEHTAALAEASRQQLAARQATRERAFKAMAEPKEEVPKTPAELAFAEHERVRLRKIRVQRMRKHRAQLGTACNG